MSASTPPLGSWRLTGLLCLLFGFSIGGATGYYALESNYLNEILSFVSGTGVGIGLLGLGFLVWQGPAEGEGSWPVGWWFWWAASSASIGFWTIFLLLFRTENDFGWTTSILLATFFGPGFVYFLIRIFRSASKD